jgi:uncharacterized protein (TIGR02118 family)
MAKFVALYDKPEDVEGFEKHLRETHLEIVGRWPGVRAVRTTRFSSTPRGTDAPYHVMVEAEFSSDEELAAAMRSESGAESARDAKAMAEQFGIRPTMLLGNEL